MADSDLIAAKVADLVIQRCCDKAWIYWPPGPMLGQVFDAKRCREEITQLIRRLMDEG